MPIELSVSPDGGTAGFPAGPPLGDLPVRDSIRGDISDLFVRLEQSEAYACTRPSRTKYLLLVFGFLRRLLALHLEFVDELEHERSPRPGPVSET